MHEKIGLCMKNKYEYRMYCCILIVSLFVLAGCSDTHLSEEQSIEIQEPEIELQTAEIIQTDTQEEITAPILLLKLFLP